MRFRYPLSVERLPNQTLSEPVTLAELKAQCRIDFDDDDAWLEFLITAAREAVELATQRSLIESDWVAYFEPGFIGERCILPRPSYISNEDGVSVTKIAAGGIFNAPGAEPVSVTYRAGACPQLAKMAVLLWASHLYEIRQPFGEKVDEVPASLTEFIARLRVRNI